MGFIKLQQGNLAALVCEENQQLVSLRYRGHEIMHGGGNPDSVAEDKEGWPNSEIVMFPVVGPVAGSVIRVANGPRRGSYPMAQHGLVRHLPWALVGTTATEAEFSISYEANTSVLNTKRKTADDPACLVWPYSFTIRKRFRVSDTALDTSFLLQGDIGMPYEFGWHPAFRTYAPECPDDALVHLSDHSHYPLDDSAPKEVVRLDDIHNASGNALKSLKFEAMCARFVSGPYDVELTSNLKRVVLWRPTPRLLCVEPVTRLPDHDPKLFVAEEPSDASGSRPSRDSRNPAPQIRLLISNKNA